MYEYAANQLVAVIHHLFYVQSSIHLEYQNAVMSEFVWYFDNTLKKQ